MGRNEAHHVVNVSGDSEEYDAARTYLETWGDVIKWVNRPALLSPSSRRLRRRTAFVVVSVSLVVTPSYEHRPLEVKAQ